jgi:hypothetical protein
MTDDKLKEAIDAAVQQACDKLYEKLNNKLERLLADINGRLPKHPVVTVMPEEETVEAPSAMKVPFAYVPSGCVLSGDGDWVYKFPIRVDSGGEVKNVHLTTGQFMHISSGGTCTDCTITDTARFSAQDGAVINNLTVNEGAFVLVISSGAYVEDTNVLYGGTLAVASGGSAWVVRVGPGGTMKVREGAKVENVIVHEGGRMEILDKNASLDNIEICCGGHIQFQTEACKEAFVSSGVILEALGATESFLDAANITSGGSDGDDNVR